MPSTAVEVEEAAEQDAELVAGALRLGGDAPVLARAGSPSNSPSTVCVLPTSTASSIAIQAREAYAET